MTRRRRYARPASRSGEPEDFSDLAEETRVEPEGEDEMIFDDLGVAAAAIESPAGPPGDNKEQQYSLA